MQTYKENPFKGSGSGSGSDGGHTPREDANSLINDQYATVLDLLSEGEIYGFVHPATADDPNAPLQDIYLDGSPVRNPNTSDGAVGAINFTNYSYMAVKGTVDQVLDTGWPLASSATSVGVEIRKDRAVVRDITDPRINAVYIVVGTGAFMRQTDNGDTVGNTVDFAIDLALPGEDYKQLGLGRLEGKTNAGYSRRYKIILPTGGSGPYRFRVRRLTDDTTSSLVQDKIYWQTYIKVVEARLRYPYSAILCSRIAAKDFSSVPSRQALIYGLLIQIPANYNPWTREYRTTGPGTSNGVWDGTFVVGWTKNPAWILRDLCISARYGLGEYLKDANIDKWQLYQIAQYCDEMVDDGFGGKEPRFTCTVQIRERTDALKLVTQFAGIMRCFTWVAGMQVAFSQDRPQEPAALYTNANVINGEFSYASTGRSARHTVSYTTWLNPENAYQPEPESFSIPEAMERYGVRELETVAFGATSRGQALRQAAADLFSEHLLDEVVTFSAGLDALNMSVGEVFEVADQDRTGTRCGGRVVGISGAHVPLAGSIQTYRTVTLDAPVPLQPAVQQTSVDSVTGKPVFYYTNVGHFFLTLADGSVVKADCVNLSGMPETATVELLSDIGGEVVDYAVWTITLPDAKRELWRCTGIKAGNGRTFDITGLKYDESIYALIDGAPSFSRLGPATSAQKANSARPQPTTYMWDSLEVTYTNPEVPTQRLSISWVPAANTSSYSVRTRLNGGVWTTYPETRETTLDFGTVVPGTYDIEITSNDTLGRSAKYATTLTVSDAAIRKPVPGTVTGLKLVNIIAGSNNNFDAGDAVFAWDAADSVTSWVVKVLDGSKELYATTRATPDFTYTDAIAASVGRRRTFSVGVWGVNVEGTSAQPALLTVVNAQIGATAVTAQQSGAGLSVRVAAAAPTASDYAGTVFAIGRDPMADPRTLAVLADAPTWETTVIASWYGTWYAWAAHYDKIGKDGLQWSPAFKFEMVEAVGGVTLIDDATKVGPLPGQDPPGGDAFNVVYDRATGDMAVWDKVSGTYVFAPTSDSIRKKIQDAIAGLAPLDAVNTAIAKEVADRTSAINAEAKARADAILNAQNALSTQITNTSTQHKTAEDALAQAIAQVAAGTGDQFDPVKIWYFDTDLEGWSGSTGTPTLKDGWLHPVAGTDPYHISSAVSIPAASYRFVKARLRKVGAPKWEGSLYWATAAHPVFDGQLGLASAAEPVWDANGIATVSWDNIPWINAGTVTQIRIDCSAACDDTNYIDIDWVAIGRPTPGAGVAALQSEAQARAAADAAEATARDTLAAQMRGSATGTDISQVTSGLIYSEKTARATADSALSSRIDSIQAAYQNADATMTARIAAEETTRAQADSALATRTSALEAASGAASDNLLPPMAAWGANATASIAANVGPNGDRRDPSYGYLKDSNATLNSPNITLKQGGTQYALSFMARVENATSATLHVDLFPDTLPETAFTLTQADQRFVWTFATSNLADFLTCCVRLFCPSAGAAYVWDVQLNEGTVAKPWTVSTAYTLARIAMEETTRATADSALSTRIDSVQAGYQTAVSQVSAQIAAEQTARAQADSANATSIQQITASLTGGANLAVNPAFEAGAYGWTGPGWKQNAADAPAQFYVQTPDPNSQWTPSGITTLVMHRPGTPATGIQDMGNGTQIPVEPGGRYCISAYMTAHRCAADFFIVFFDASGVQAGEWHTPSTTKSSATNGHNLAEWDRPFVFVTIPANGVTATLNFRMYPDAAGRADPYLFACRPMLERATAAQTQPSPWSPSAAAAYGVAIQTQQQATATANAVSGSYGLTINANGYVSGVKSYNNGATSSLLLTQDQVAITPSNMIPDAEFRSPATWMANAPTVSAINAAWPTGVSAADGTGTSEEPLRWLKILAGSPTMDIYGQRKALTSGQAYRVKLHIYRSSDFKGKVFAGVHFPNYAWGMPGNFAGDPDWMGGLPHVTEAAAGLGQWMTYDGIWSPTAGITWFQTRIAATVTAGYCAIALDMCLATGASLLVDGSITAQKLSADVINTVSLNAKNAVVSQLSAGAVSSVFSKTGRLQANIVQVFGGDTEDWGRLQSGNKWWRDGQDGWALGRNSADGSTLLEFQGGNGTVRLCSWGDNLISFPGIAMDNSGVRFSGTLIGPSGTLGEVTSGLIRNSTSTTRLNLNETGSGAVLTINGRDRVYGDGHTNWSNVILGGYTVYPRKNGVTVAAGQSKGSAYTFFSAETDTDGNITGYANGAEFTVDTGIRMADILDAYDSTFHARCTGWSIWWNGYTPTANDQLLVEARPAYAVPVGSGQDWGTVTLRFIVTIRMKESANSTFQGYISYTNWVGFALDGLTFNILRHT